MRTRNHANKRGRSHQWHVGLTAWTVYGWSSTAAILCTYCSVSSYISGGVFSSFFIVSSPCLCVHGSFEAPKQSRGAWLAGVIGESYAPDLFASPTRHHVPERGCAPCACEREWWRVYGPWPSSLSLAPVCCACDEKMPRESSGYGGDFGRPCAASGRRR